jgi:copper chaperone NosL
MRPLILLTLAFAVAGCAAAKPVNVVTGEACWRCRQPINDKLLAAEILSSNGLASKFRTIHCMSTWIAQQKTTPEGTSYVTDYGTGKWVRAERATYVHTIVNQNTMARDFVAFLDQDEAEDKARADNSAIATWDEVLARGRSSPLP